MRILILGVLCGFLFGCGSTPRFADSGTSVADDKSGPAPWHIKDSGPKHDVKVDHIPDAIPTHEMVTLAGNKTPYTVLGKTYHINFNTKGFSQKGYASWYGNKFHGRKTSNGEVYDMYAMSAAHKTLPIPCYVQVTNLSNNKKVIVRVNDRGPFHSDRIIDLSYTAAKKLGFHKQGTAKVQIDVVNTEAQIGSRSGDSGYRDKAKFTYLQLGAFSQKKSAEQLKNKVAMVTGYPIIIKTEPERRLYKVLVGPLLDNFDLLTLRQKLADENMAHAHVVEM